MQVIDRASELTPKKLRKEKAFERTTTCFGTYKKFLVVELTNISSRQIQLIRTDLGSDSIFLMGKNTTIRAAIRKNMGESPEMQDILSVIKNNVGIVFTNGDLKDICKIIDDRKVFACAKPGNVSQCDLWIEPLFTGLDPGKTSFFQALGIATKITKGKIEILSRCNALTRGKKVGPSEASLLTLLGITPFTYKMGILYAYADGKFFDISHLEIGEADVSRMFESAISQLAALSLGSGFVTEASISQEIAAAVRGSCSIALAVDYEMKELTALLSAPSASAAPTPAPAEAAKPAAVEEEEEEDSGDLDLF